MSDRKRGSKTLQRAIDSLKSPKESYTTRRQINLKSTTTVSNPQTDIHNERLGLDGAPPVFQFIEPPAQSIPHREEVNAYGAGIGTTRAINGELRKWISMEDINWELQSEGSDYNRKCVKWLSDPDVCVERVKPSLKKESKVTYALKDFKGSKSHSGYTHISLCTGMHNRHQQAPPQLRSLSLLGPANHKQRLGSYEP